MTFFQARPWRVLATLLGLMLATLALGLGVLLALLTQAPPSKVPESLPRADRALQLGNQGQVRALFMGTSSLAFSDGRTTWLVDGFFSRPPMSEVLFRRLHTNPEALEATTQHMAKRLGVQPTLSGIVVAHSHYDHSMDAPWLAQRYGGQVIGSESTRQIALGQGLDDEQVLLVQDGQQVVLGDFTVTVMHSAHAPTGFTGGFNSSPLALPAHALAFKEGQSYSYLVSHNGETLALIQPSAGFIPGQYVGVKAPVVLLGVGGLGKLGEDYTAKYWQEVVVTTGARTVLMIHWDDFTLPIFAQGREISLAPMPNLVDDLDSSLAHLQQLAQQDGVELQLLNAWDALQW